MIYSEDKASFFSAIRARMRTMLLFEGKEPTIALFDFLLNYRRSSGPRAPPRPPLRARE